MFFWATWRHHGGQTPHPADCTEALQSHPCPALPTQGFFLHYHPTGGSHLLRHCLCQWNQKWMLPELALHCCHVKHPKYKCLHILQEKDCNSTETVLDTVWYLNYTITQKFHYAHQLLMYSIFKYLYITSWTVLKEKTSISLVKVTLVSDAQNLDSGKCTKLHSDSDSHLPGQTVAD